MLEVAIIGTGFGARVVGSVYREAGMKVDIASPRDRDAVGAAIAARPDLVSIHSPPFLHAEHVAMALDAGCNVLCDKPFGSSAAQAQEMLDAARVAGILHFVNFEFRHEPARAALKQMIEEGAIGAIRSIQWTAFHSGSRIPLRAHGWLFDRNQGGGWIGAFGSHVIDAIRWLGGDIVDAQGLIRTDISERPDPSGRMQASTAEDGFAALLRLAGGATATIETSYASPVTLPPRIIVAGSEGIAELLGTTEIILHRPGEAPRIERFTGFDGDPHLPAMRAWAQILRQTLEDGVQIEPSFADGLACAIVLDRLRSTARPDG
jgi:predicted dehydrogenase